MSALSRVVLRGLRAAMPKGEGALPPDSGLPNRRIDRPARPGDAEGANAFALRRYRPADEEAAIALWLKSWTAAYPDIDFAARLVWWRTHWQKLAAAAKIVVAETTAAAPAGADPTGAMIGFVTVEPHTRYVDQLVVAPEFWGKAVGAALLDEAKRLSPAGIDLDVNTDNARAVGFYRRNGFVVSGDGVNSLSGRPVHHMRWRP